MTPNPGATVAIISGHFRGYEGTVKELDSDTQQAILLIELFGYETPVEVPIEALSTDLDGLRRELAKEKAADYEQWTAKTCESLKIRRDADPNLAREAAAGSYVVEEGINARVIKLLPTGQLELFRWHDLGGSWGVVHSGYYLVHADVVHTSVRDIEFFCRNSFDRDGLLYLRRLFSQRILVTSDFVDQFDQWAANVADEPISLADAVEGWPVYYETKERIEER